MSTRRKCCLFFALARLETTPGGEKSTDSICLVSRHAHSNYPPLPSYSLPTLPTLSYILATTQGLVCLLGCVRRQQLRFLTSFGTTFGTREERQGQHDEAN